jgi:predicted O-methyltransferase YrrM
MAERDWDPKQILDISGYYWRTCALHAAVKLGLFTSIGQHELSVEEIAGNTRTHERGLAMLLDALAALGLLVKSGETYAVHPTALPLLDENSPRYIGHMIKHHHFLLDSWSKLDQAVREGSPVRSRASRDDPERREAFLMGMFTLAMSIAPQLVPTIDLSGRKHLLDLGGGPGTYAIHFCLHNPKLAGTIYDLATTRPFAENTVAKFGLSDRVHFLEGDYLNQDIPGSYDVAWLSQILHAEGPETCREIVRKAASVLEPGGLIFIHEFILDDSKDKPLHPALFSLNMLLGTAAGRSYSERELREMLTQAGVRGIRRLPFQGPNESRVLAGMV